MRSFLTFISFMVIYILVMIALFIALSYGECRAFRSSTGYFTMFSWGTCYVLIDDTYPVDKNNLRGSDRPAMDPELN